MYSTKILTLFICIVILNFVNCESNLQSKTLAEDEASQWLQRNGRQPSRFHSHRHNSNYQSEVDRTLKRLQMLNDNGVGTFDQLAFEGVPMEVLFEMVKDGKGLTG
ncbi:unnamed protein product [Didymodactylos carnosus]|uniref:Uncharacterized protein n=1 Tax=Didymodactylos carnosus TaxID=1234261 RepID=A0A815N655_9BILA|nr:unnamed protein product [Didymodactylos carnosus]CAF4309381.1 unnamed protein product [Didymodactylos carnosus]